VVEFRQQAELGQVINFFDRSGLMKETSTGAQPKEGALVIPEEVQEETRKLVEGAFRLFADHTTRLADELTAFNKKGDEVAGRIKRGARRTSGRIV
jgi:hypothetical protein